MASKTAKTAKKNINETVDAVEDAAHKTGSMVRRAALAYLGMYGVAYEEAQARLNSIRGNSDEWFDRLVQKGAEIEAQAGDLFEDAQSKVNESASKVRDAIRPSNVVDIKVKTTKTKTKPAAKKTTSKKRTAKKTVVKKKVAKKPISKKTVTTKTTPKAAAVTKVVVDTPVAKATVTTQKVKSPSVSKPTIASAMSATAIQKDDRYEAYVVGVRAYDKFANPVIVKKIVDHCGIALRSQDGRFVACSDETERNTVRDSWLTKHLGVNGEIAELDAKVMAVCETMANDHMKNRVTFYYLLAQQESKLAAI